MKISVIVPTFNREHLLKETMESILNQTFKDFELIIVDNYSVDKTEELVKSYNDKRIRYFKNHNSGIVAVNRNFGIKKAKGDFVAFCDDDDLWFPNKLEKQLLEFEEDEKIGLVCTNGFSFDEKHMNRKMLKKISKNITFTKLLFDNTIICSSVLIKKSVLDDIGMFCEDQKICAGEDYELWLRVAKKYKIKYVGVPLIKYRVHAKALQKQYLVGDKTLNVSKEVYNKLLEEKIIDINLYKRALGRLNYKYINLRLMNNDNTINLKNINKVKMNFWEKLRLTVLYILFRAKILNILKRNKKTLKHM